MDKRVLVLGAGGIVGQHMRKFQPLSVEAVYVRRTPGADPEFVSADLTSPQGLKDVLDLAPDLVVNLAGENRPDVVEQDPFKHRAINVDLPLQLAAWAHECSDRFLLQASTQGVFSGQEPPYTPSSPLRPVNVYGAQKAEAEALVLPWRRNGHANWLIARLTFILGLQAPGRPVALVGRMNPLEQMFAQGEQRQVVDRWFSPLFAADAGRILWELVLGYQQRRGRIVHLGIPLRVNRYWLACAAKRLLGQEAKLVQPVPHDSFPGLAPRPFETTWAEGSLFKTPLMEGLQQCADEWKTRHGPGEKQ